MQQQQEHIVLSNKEAVLQVDLLGGAISDFHLQGSSINPLSFSFPQPAINGEQSYFKGHFVCLGRWGDPTPAEQHAGIVKHGDANRLRWTAVPATNGYKMQATSTTEGLFIERNISLHSDKAVFTVEENVTNTGQLGRLFNLVQHPTIAEPFLSNRTIVDCNAMQGFDYSFEHYTQEIMRNWPIALLPSGDTMDLRRPLTAYNSVFSYVVDPAAEWGWITAYSPAHHLLLGYCWPRNDYPWINCWMHWLNGSLLYRGLEFGTTGVHKPYSEILGLTSLLGERTVQYLDPAKPATFRYTGFLQQVEPGFAGVENILFDGNNIQVVPRHHKNNTGLWNTPIKPL